MPPPEILCDGYDIRSCQAKLSRSRGNLPYGAYTFALPLTMSISFDWQIIVLHNLFHPKATPITNPRQSENFEVLWQLFRGR